MGDPWVPRDKVSATTTKASVCSRFWKLPSALRSGVAVHPCILAFRTHLYNALWVLKRICFRILKTP